MFLSFARVVWQAQPPPQEALAQRPPVAQEATVYVDSGAGDGTWGEECPALAQCLPELPKPATWDPSAIGGREMASAVHKTPRFYRSGGNNQRARPVQSRRDFGTWLRQNDPHAPPGTVPTDVPTHGRTTVNRKVRPEKAFRKAQRAMALMLCDTVAAANAKTKRVLSRSPKQAVYARCGYCSKNFLCGPGMETIMQEHMKQVHTTPSGSLSVHGLTTVHKVKIGIQDLQNSVLQGKARKRLRASVRKSAATRPPAAKRSKKNAHRNMTPSRNAAVRPSASPTGEHMTASKKQTKA